METIHRLDEITHGVMLNFAKKAGKSYASLTEEGLTLEWSSGETRAQE